MEKYVFTKKVSMGFIKRNAEPGQTVEFGKGYAMFRNEKITDLRDFQILKKHKILIPASQVKEEIQQQKVEQKQNNFGFEIKKETEQTNVIPLEKFVKATQIDQTKAFVQEDGIIKDGQSKQVHVAKAETKEQKKEETEQNAQEELTVSDQIYEDGQEENQKKTSNKKSTTKKTAKISKKDETSTVRGMKVIKEN